MSVATEQSICARHSATSLPLDTGSENGVASALRSARRSPTKPSDLEDEDLSSSGEEDDDAAAPTAEAAEATTTVARAGAGEAKKRRDSLLFETAADGAHRPRIADGVADGHRTTTGLCCCCGRATTGRRATPARWQRAASEGAFMIA